MSEEQRHRRQIFLDMVEVDAVDRSRVDLQHNDGAVVVIRVGQERVSFLLEQLRLDGLKAAATAIVPAGTFVAMSLELGAFGLGSLQVLGIVEQSRPSLAVRFEGNDLVVRERLTATVAQLADKLAASPPLSERTQIMAREHVDQSVDVLELKATVTRLMFEKEELRRDLEDFRTEALAMMRLLRREIEARHGPAPAAAAAADAAVAGDAAVAPPDVAAAADAALAAAVAAPVSKMSALPSLLPAVPTHQPGPEVTAAVRAAVNDELVKPPETTTTMSAPTTTTTTTTTTTSSAQTFASTTRRVGPAVLLGPQLIDEGLSEAEAAWNAVVESSPPAVVGGEPVEASDAGPRFDLSDL